MEDTAKYMEEILEKFNADPADPTLTEMERKLLTGAKLIQDQIVAMDKEVKAMAEENKAKQEEANQLIQENMNKSQELKQKMIYLQGQAQGFIDSLLALK